MAKPHCSFCAALGHRECDICGGPVFDHNERTADGRDLCGYCLEDAA